MQICGIISEYNPLHRGHMRHLSLAREASGADALIVVMSGPLVQRGEPAVADPLLRARWAVGAGADLVLELPAAYACHGAQLFARGAVGLLHGLGCVDSFCFGCEAADPERLWAAARLLAEEPADFRATLRTALDQGASYPRARQLALETALGHDSAELMTQANNVLALEYLQACLHFASAMNPLPVRRTGDGYRQQQVESDLPSATAIRAALRAGESPAGLPDPVREDLSRATLVFPDQLGPLVRWMLLSAGEDALARLPDMGEGLHLRLKQAGEAAAGYDAIVDAALSRRYSRPRIQRALLHGLLAMDQADTDVLREQTPLFIRPLAMGRRGPDLLSQIARASALPLVSHPARYEPKTPAEARLWRLNRRAWDLYALLTGRPAGWELSHRLEPLAPWEG